MRDPRATPALVAALGAIEADDPETQRLVRAAALAADPLLYAPLVGVHARIGRPGGTTAAALTAALTSCSPAGPAAAAGG